MAFWVILGHSSGERITYVCIVEDSKQLKSTVQNYGPEIVNKSQSV
jgi:hypothetical protein